MWTPLIALMKTYFEHTLCYLTHSRDEEAKVGEAFIDFRSTILAQVLLGFLI